MRASTRAPKRFAYAREGVTARGRHANHKRRPLIRARCVGASRCAHLAFTWTGRW